METFPKNAHCRHSQFWQSLPMNPGGQLHDPLCLSHTPPFSQAGQVSVQPGPQKPSGHTVKRLMVNILCVVISIELLKVCVHSQFSQCCPDVPAGHLHCPVTLSHGALVQLQGWMQPVPNVPSGHSDSGHTGRGCVNKAEPQHNANNMLKACSFCVHPPWSQFSPWCPGGHCRWHSPDTWWQDTPGGHEHFFTQPDP